MGCWPWDSWKKCCNSCKDSCTKCCNSCKDSCKKCCRKCYTNCDDVACCQEYLEDTTDAKPFVYQGGNLVPLDETAGEADSWARSQSNNAPWAEVEALKESVGGLQGRIKQQDEQLSATKAQCAQLEEEHVGERKEKEELRSTIRELQDVFTRSEAKSKKRVDELEHLLAREQGKRRDMKEDVEYLKERLERLMPMKTMKHKRGEPEPQERQGLASPRQTVMVPKEAPAWIVPAVLYRDDRVAGILHQLLNLVDSSIGVEPLESVLIKQHHNGRVLLPVIGASRIGSDLQATVTKAKLDTTVAPIILIYHHLASHNCKIHTATKNRLSDRGLVDGCKDMIDVVFWNSNVYECDANYKAVDRLKELTQQM